MKKFLLFSLLFLSACDKKIVISGSSPFTQRNCVVPIDKKLIVVAGDSQGSSRAFEALGFVNPHITVFGNDYKWRDSMIPEDDPTDQVNSDSLDLKVGMGPGVAFAQEFLSRQTQDFGITNCSRGSTASLQWESSQVLYWDCRDQANKMKSTDPQKPSDVHFVLLFLGGNDIVPDHTWADADHFANTFNGILKSFHFDFPNAVILWPRIESSKSDPSIYPNYQKVRDAEELVNSYGYPWARMIDADNLDHESDNVHLSWAGYQALSKRMVDSYLGMVCN